jgi:hypothetical protein
MTSVDLDIDVTEAAGLGEPATVAVSVVLPDPEAIPADGPIVCFGKPGGGYAKGYYTVDLPGPGRGAQAAWHAERGWVFVAVDHLGVGASSTDHDSARLDFAVVAAANHAAEVEVLRRLADATLVDGFPPIVAPLRLGIGQSMGGSLTIIQQGRHRSYDGVGILGYSAVHTHPPTAPGTPAIALPWVSRDTLLGERMVILNEAALVLVDDAPDGEQWRAMAWGFHYDDVDEVVVVEDMVRGEVLPPWASVTIPVAVAMACLTPGGVTAEAAALTVPVLVAMGERDVLVDPRAELRAYRSSTSVDWYVCPRMGHMHNFAGTRELFWQRIDTWARWVRHAAAAASAR